MGEDELVRRILDEADMAARPGQYDRLVAIANEVAALRESHRAALREIAALEKAWETGIKAVEYRVLADLRAKASRLTGHRPGDGTVWRADVLALIEEVGDV